MRVFGGGQMVVVTRDVQAIRIPDGDMVMIEKDHEVYITQVLGGMFTVETEMGYLARVDGKDADALGQIVPQERKSADQLQHEATHKPIEEQIRSQLSTCYDPEIPVNILELGLIYKCDATPLEGGGFRVDVQMTLTAPGCGMGGVLKSDVEQKLLELPDVKTVNIDLVFDPAWDQSMMSEAARLQLGMM